MTNAELFLSGLKKMVLVKHLCLITLFKYQEIGLGTPSLS